MRAILCLFIFIAIVCVGLSRDLGKMLTRRNESPSVAMAASPRPEPHRSQVATSSRTVSIENDGRGHFRLDARVDGRPIEFLVDTGATMIVLRESSAARLGLFPRPSEYVGRTQTANGVAKYAPVTLDRVEVNGITVRDVGAAVMPDEAVKVNLLGMTFLSRVKFTHDRGRLVLEQ